MAKGRWALLAQKAEHHAVEWRLSVSNRAGACQGCRLSRVQAAARNRVGDGTLRLGLEAGVQSV